MSMKNHLGTFDPKWAHVFGATDYLLAINKTPQVLGDLSTKSGEILFPRQQLCIIDALWASEEGPGCDTSCQPNRLYMGTFAPALDYQVATQFRKGTMGWDINEEVTERFLSEFGFQRSDLPNGGRDHRRKCGLVVRSEGIALRFRKGLDHIDEGIIERLPMVLLGTG